MTIPPTTQDDLTCKELVELVTEYLEGGLPAADRARFDRHLESCPFCTTYVDQMRSTIQALGHLPAETLSQTTLERLRAHFRDWHRAGSASEPRER